MTKEELEKASKFDLQQEIRWKLGHNVNVNQTKDKLRVIIETFIGVEENVKEVKDNERNVRICRRTD